MVKNNLTLEQKEFAQQIGEALDQDKGIWYNKSCWRKKRVKNYSNSKNHNNKIEKLIEECLDESFGKSGIKQEVKNAINSKLDKVTGANIGRCYILAITNID